MKRSSVVNLVLITAVTGVAGCNSKPTRYCVDSNNSVLDDRDCPKVNAQPGVAHWYYGGAHGGVPIGTKLNGGTIVEPSEGFSTADESVTARGVVGEAGESASGHAGSGEGAGE
jgi:hypothetical protein